MILYKGWEQAEDISQSSGIISLAANSVLTECLKIIIPSGARLFIESLTARVIDAGSDSVVFYCLRNGMSVAPGLTAINGTLFDFIGPFLIQRDVGPGETTIYADNAAGGIIRVNVSLQCFLLRMIQDENNPGAKSLRYAYRERY